MRVLEDERSDPARNENAGCFVEQEVRCAFQAIRAGASIVDLPAGAESHEPPPVPSAQDLY